MKALPALFVLIMLPVLLTSCKDDINNFDPTEDPLTGMIEGNEWTYGSGNASYSLSGSTLSGLIIADDPEDPCAVVVTNKAHLTVKFPPRRGNYNLPYINNTGTTADVIFHYKGGANKFTATSGFLEIVQITSTEVIGFISADYDDNNRVEGAFFLKVCN